MAERSFTTQVKSLRLGAGEVFEGEAVVAVAKALLQAGVAYVGGYQGAPVSHLMDVFGDASDILRDLGVRFESSASEATAAAMLGASINYPLRGAVTWKSTVGTNVASDALGNLSSAGVVGGALIVLGEDYGEGASIMQERTHAFAMKSQIWLLDPRPHLPTIVNMVEQGFELSEASQTPVMLMLRVRACHMHGRFVARDNIKPRFAIRDALARPLRSPARIILPPATYQQEQEKIDVRWPAAVHFIREQKLNEIHTGSFAEIGIIMQGGLYNTVLRCLELMNLADAFGQSRVPLYVLNATYPLVADEFVHFAAGKQALLIVEEGQPEFIEQAATQFLRQADLQTRVIGKGPLPVAGEYTGAILRKGLEAFIKQWLPSALAHTKTQSVARELPLLPLDELKRVVPSRPPGLCTGCPERPLFSSMKLIQRELGPLHISADIGCHSFATLAPFHLGNSIMGYGLGPAGAAAFSEEGGLRPVALMGDGGFWHNGLTSGIGNAVFNHHDGVTVIVDNGYSAATGGQHIPSSRANSATRGTHNSIERAVRGVGVNWVRTVSTYHMQSTMQVLREALTTQYRGPKVIIAEGECQLNRQRRIAPLLKRIASEGGRVVKERFGVDPDLCTGDHSCIRLSGCPSLTIKPSEDPLRSDPIAHVNNDCVGCGVCGEVAHAAALCPSFYRADVVTNPTRWDRLLFRWRSGVIGLLQRRHDYRTGDRTRRENSVLPSGCGNVTRDDRHSRERAREELKIVRRVDSNASARRATQRITLAIAALGGQGGGVVADWLIDVAKREGWLAQATSVPGVAQRTGATIYYLEFFPLSAVPAGGREPVFALMPTPGDVDIVLASEIMETGRALQRGIITPDRTTVISSTNRVYAISEKAQLSDGRADDQRIVELARQHSQRFIAFDMQEVSQSHGSFINAVMLGALAGSGALPFATESYREALRARGVGVSASAAAFDSGCMLAVAGSSSARRPTAQAPAAETVPQGLAELIDRAAPLGARAIVRQGVNRLIDYQDEAYARLYLRRLEQVSIRAHCAQSAPLMQTVARELALWMSFEDTIRVADLKIRSARVRRIRDEATVEPAQLLHVTEFMKPRFAELCGTMPAWLGARLLRSRGVRRLMAPFLEGRRIATSRIGGFLLLYLLASCRRWRRATLRYTQENARLTAWLDAIENTAATAPALAVEIAECHRLVRGYGETYERGVRSFDLILARALAWLGRDDAAMSVRALRVAATADDEGAALARMLKEAA